MKTNTEIFSRGVRLPSTHMRAFNNRPRSKKPGGPFAVRWAARLPLFFILFISMGLFACGGADDNDAFPNDPCAATDTDGDGDPDSIVAGCSTSLTEDTDDDNDGIADDSEAEGQRLLPDCGGAPTPAVRIQEGTQANPYCIDTLAELQSIETGFTNGYTTGNSLTRTRAQSLGYHYRLVANIDAWPTNSASSRPGSITYVDGNTAAPAAYDSSSYANGFDPIGDCGTNDSCRDTSDTPFSGSFEGGGYTIHGLRIVGMAAGHYGLFGALNGSSARISNLHLREVDIDGSSHIGALVGLVGEALVTNTSMSGTVDGGDGGDNVGGLVGRGILTTGIIQNSYATGAVNGGDGADNVGGLVGIIIGTVRNSYATGTVDGGDGADFIGGLAGFVQTGGIAQNSYATGTVDGGGGTDRVGGLAGATLGTVLNSYATGTVNGGDGSNDFVGGLAGVFIGGISQYNYHNSDASVTGGGIQDPPTGTGKSMAELQALDAAKTLLDFPGGQWSTNFWAFGTASQYPALRSYKTDGINVVEGDLLCGQPASRAQCP